MSNQCKVTSKRASPFQLSYYVWLAEKYIYCHASWLNVYLENFDIKEFHTLSLKIFEQKYSQTRIRYPEEVSKLEWVGNMSWCLKKWFTNFSLVLGSMYEKFVLQLVHDFQRQCILFQTVFSLTSNFNTVLSLMCGSCHFDSALNDEFNIKFWFFFCRQ